MVVKVVESITTKKMPKIIQDECANGFHFIQAILHRKSWASSRLKYHLVFHKDN